MVATGALGWLFERVIVRPVYGFHLKQILVTMGGLIIAQQLIHRDLGAGRHHPVAAADAEGLGGDRRARDRDLPHPGGGAWAGACSSPCGWSLTRTRIGLLVRAGVENGEMVEALGYRIRRLFVGVFVAGSALAGVGGRDVGALPGDHHGAHGLGDHDPGVHRRHHRRARLDRGLLRRRAAGRPDGQLCRRSWRPRWRWSPTSG